MYDAGTEYGHCLPNGAWLIDGDVFNREWRIYAYKFLRLTGISYNLHLPDDVIQIWPTRSREISQHLKG